MTEDNNVRITNREIYDDVQKVKNLIAERLPEGFGDRLRKAEQQIAAQWVVVGIVVAGLGGLLVKVLSV